MNIQVFSTEILPIFMNMIGRYGAVDIGFTTGMMVG